VVQNAIFGHLVGENSTGNSGMVVVDARVELIILDFHPCLMKTLCHSRVYDTCLLH
jgi:hypothetical protein